MKGSILSLFIRKILGFHHKINSLALFLFLIPVLSFAATPVNAGMVVFDVQTRINVTYDGKKELLDTKKPTIGEALAENNIQVGDKDAVIPSSDTNLKGGTVDVEVKRAAPYAVNDDGKKSVVLSGYTDSKDILKQNNIIVYPEDKIYTNLIDDFYNDDSLGEGITIRRAPVIYVNVDGSRKEYRSWQNTIEGVLKEKNVLVGDKDKVDPSLDDSFTNETEVTITRVAESEVKETETIPFSVQTIEDPNLEYGKTYVEKDGVNGSKELTYKIISENGVLTQKNLISTVVVSEPVTKVIVNGTKPINTFYGVASHMSPGVYSQGGCAFRGYSGSTLKVTNLNNGRSVLVRVIDYGPAAYTGRIIDLSYDDFYSLSGTTGLMSNIKVEVLN